MGGKRGNGEGSIFRYGKKWRASISVIGPDGTRIRKTKTCATRADAVAELEQLRVTARTPVPEDDPTTVSQWLTRWLEIGKANWAANTHAQQESIVRNWVVDAIGAVRLTRLSADDVRMMLAKAKSERGAKPRTLQLMRGVLLTALNVAVDDGRIPLNPVAKVKKPSSDSDAVRPFTEQEVATILRETKGGRYHAAYALGLTMGMRIGEVLGLRAAHLDLEAGTIRIEEQLVDLKGQVARSKPKTKHSRRTVQLTATAREALIAHQEIMSREANLDSDFLFPARRGGPTRRTNFARRYWNSLLRRLKIDHRGFHHCRHTFATLALRDGVPVTVVSAILGHASPDITYRVYSHFMPGDQALAVAAMDAIVSRGSSVAITKPAESP
jgi:integrase